MRQINVQNIRIGEINWSFITRFKEHREDFTHAEGTRNENTESI